MLSDNPCRKQRQVLPGNRLAVMRTTPGTVSRSREGRQHEVRSHLLSDEESMELAQARQVLCALHLHALTLGIRSLESLRKLLHTGRRTNNACSVWWYCRVDGTGRLV